jgi:hypothetical protein
MKRLIPEAEHPTRKINLEEERRRKTKKGEEEQEEQDEAEKIHCIGAEGDSHDISSEDDLKGCALCFKELCSKCRDMDKASHCEMCEHIGCVLCVSEWRGHSVCKDCQWMREEQEEEEGEY